MTILQTPAEYAATLRSCFASFVTPVEIVIDLAKGYPQLPASYIKEVYDELLKLEA